MNRGRLLCLLFLLTNRQTGRGRVSGAALASGDAAASLSFSGSRQHPVGSRAHRAQCCTCQNPTWGTASAASFSEMIKKREKERKEGGIQRGTKLSQRESLATSGFIV